MNKFQARLIVRELNYHVYMINKINIQNGGVSKKETEEITNFHRNMADILYAYLFQTDKSTGEQIKFDGCYVCYGGMTSKNGVFYPCHIMSDANGEFDYGGFEGR